MLRCLSTVGLRAVQWLSVGKFCREGRVTDLERESQLQVGTAGRLVRAADGETAVRLDDRPGGRPGVVF